MTIFPDLTIEHTSVAQDVSITLRSTLSTAVCPRCGVTATRVQSRYTRTSLDLPVSGRSVHLIVRVRRFFCDNTDCLRAIFAEQFPFLVRPRAKVTAQYTIGTNTIDVPTSEVSWSPHRSRSVVQTQRARRAERVDRYEQVISLQQQGLRTAEIAHRVGMSERTVRS